MAGAASMYKAVQLLLWRQRRMEARRPSDSATHKKVPTRDRNFGIPRHPGITTVTWRHKQSAVKGENRHFN